MGQSSQFDSTSSTPYSHNSYVISIFSLRGGVGKTTLSVNLAAALAELWRVKVALLDAALDTAHCGLMLDIKPKLTLANLYDWKQPITDQVIDELLNNHASGVSLLTAADTPMQGEQVSPQVLSSAWPLLERRFPFIIVDAGRGFNETNLYAMQNSDVILLLFSPELASVKSTTDAIDAMAMMRFDRQKLLPAVNWVFPGSPILLSRITQTLKVNLAGEIPFDSAHCIQAINTGKTLVEQAPNSPVAQAIITLAYRLSKNLMETKGIASDSPLLSKSA